SFIYPPGVSPSRRGSDLIRRGPVRRLRIHSGTPEAVSWPSASHNQSVRYDFDAASIASLQRSGGPATSSQICPPLAKAFSRPLLNYGILDLWTPASRTGTGSDQRARAVWTNDTEPMKSPAEPMVRGLSNGGRRIRTIGSAKAAIAALAA